MDKPVAGQNWHGPESDTSGQYCWTGPGSRATLRLPIKRDRETLAVITYYMPVIAEQMRKFHVEVDGIAIPHSIRTDISPKCIVLRLPVRDTPDDGETELALVLPTVSPSSLPGGSPDKRLLGIAVYSVSAIPAEPALPARFPLSRFESLRRRMGLSRRGRPLGDFPLSHFDGLAYMEAYSDVAEAVIAGLMPSALEHYRRHGRKEGRRFAFAVVRTPNEGDMADLFDGLAYLEMYPDVAEAIRSEREPSALEHFLKYGRKEGRRFAWAVVRAPNKGDIADLFDGLAYLEKYPDVADAVRSETEHSAFQHYLKYGRKEGRRVRTRFDGQVRRGTAFDLLRLDTTRLARANNDVLKSELGREIAASNGVLKSELGREIAAKSDQLGGLLTKLQSTVSNLDTLPGKLSRIEQLSREEAEQLRTQLSELARAHEAREQDLLFQLDALRSGSKEVQRDLAAATRVDALERVRQEIATELAVYKSRERALIAQIDALNSGLTEAQQRLAVAAQVDETADLKLETLQNRVHKEIVAALAREQALLGQVETLKTGLTDAQQRLAAAAQADETTGQKLETLQDSVHKEIATALAREQALLGQVETLKTGFAEAQHRLATAAQADEVEQVKTEMAKALIWGHGLSKQVEAIKSGLVEAQLRLATAARADEVEQVKAEIAKALTWGQGLSEQVDAVKSGLAEAQQRLAAAARTDEMEQVKTEITKTLAWERSLFGQVDAIKSGLADAQQRLAGAARADQLEQVRKEVAAESTARAARAEELDRIKRDATRELERVRGEIANALAMREAREQAVLEQIELLRISLDESQRKLSSTARTEDLDRLKRDATQDFERVRSEIASTSAVESARAQTLLAQIDTLKAEINSAKTRAELAEVKVASAERELGAEARDIAASVQHSSATLDRLRNEITDSNKVRDSKETVIRTELDLVKHELSVAQVANLMSSTSKDRKGKNNGKSLSQLGQDLWVLQKTQFKKGGYFVDIGATDGVLLSNTYLLEKHYDWKGICVEPDPVAFEKLSKNRQSRNSNACLWSSSGQELDFILAKEYGGVSSTAALDTHANKRRAYQDLGQTIKVKTTSLNDLLENVKAPNFIDYISLDTEGSEHEILKTFDFKRWKVRMWTIEHNFTEQRKYIYELMSANGYKRREVEWDDWYFL